MVHISVDGQHRSVQSGPRRLGWCQHTYEGPYQCQNGQVGLPTFLQKHLHVSISSVSVFYCVYNPCYASCIPLEVIIGTYFLSSFFLYFFDFPLHLHLHFIITYRSLDLNYPGYRLAVKHKQTHKQQPLSLCLKISK